MVKCPVAAAREHGLHRVEGRECAVKDGDVPLFKFNVYGIHKLGRELAAFVPNCHGSISACPSANVMFALPLWRKVR